MTLTIKIKGEEWILHSSGCLFWPSKNMLLIADVHLGKISHFRKAGFAVPPDSVGRNFERLTAVVGFFQPAIVCFLGDLFHSKINNEWTLFEEWIGKTEAEVLLVAGNHDIIAPAKYLAIGVKIYSEIEIDGFLLTHHPVERVGFFNFCGHIHPCVTLRGIGRQFLKLPCFFQKPDQVILPAFGEFTGTYELTPSEDDCVYAVTKDEVIMVCGD